MTVVLLSPTKDAKIEEWGRHLIHEGVRLSLSRDRVDLLLFLLKSPHLINQHKVIFIRYMNDSHSIIKSFLQFLADLLIVFYSLLPKTKMIWLCHNVDAETVQHHPFLTKARRAMVARASSVIFTTDPLLLPYAKVCLPLANPQKFDWVTFGRMETFREDGWRGKKTEEFIKKQIDRFTRDFLTRSQKLGLRPMIGLCAASSGKKYIHFDYASELIASATAAGVNLGLIVATEPNSDITADQVKRLDRLKKNPNVLFFSRQIRLNESEISSRFDFIFRGISDYSVPATIYVAATSRKPVLALEAGFLPTLVEKYDLGCTVKLDMSDIDEALSKISSWQCKEHSISFLSNHTWQIGAKRLAKRINALF